MIQKAAEAVAGVVEGLKTQPLVLALVIMNLALLGFIYYAISISSQSRKHEFELLVGNQRELREEAREKQGELKQELDVIKQKVAP
jgi:CRISPR/Cas system-associated protein Csx1